MSTKGVVKNADVAREAILNLFSRVGVSALLIVLSMSAGFSSVWSSYGDGTVVTEQLRVYTHSGVYAFMVTSAVEEQRLSAVSCEQLNSVNGIKAAGGLQSEALGEVILGDRFSVSIIRGTPGLARFLWPETRPRGSAVIGARAAQRAGVASASALIYTASGREQIVTVNAVAAPTMRGERLDDTLFIAEALTNDAEVERCLIEPEPPYARAAQQLALSWFDGEVRINPYFHPGHASTDPQRTLENRMSRWIPLVAAITVWAVLVLTWSGRRNDYALYRVLGLNRRSLLLMLAVESALLAIVPTFAGITLALGATNLPLSHIELSLVSVAVGQLVMSTIVTPLLGYAIVGLRDPLRILKDSP